MQPDDNTANTDCKPPRVVYPPSLAWAAAGLKVSPSDLADDKIHTMPLDSLLASGLAWDSSANPVADLCRLIDTTLHYAGVALNNEDVDTDRLEGMFLDIRAKVGVIAELHRRMFAAAMNDPNGVRMRAGEVAR